MTKPTSKRPNRGLVNPTVTLRKPAIPAGAKRTTAQKPYNTHIPEPRVQRLISLILVACFVALELWFWTHRHK